MADNGATKMEDRSWTRNRHKVMYLKCLNTEWTSITRKLRLRYLIFEDGNTKMTQIKKIIDGTERWVLKNAIGRESALWLYRAREKEITN